MKTTRDAMFTAAVTALIMSLPVEEEIKVPLAAVVAWFLWAGWRLVRARVYAVLGRLPAI